MNLDVFPTIYIYIYTVRLYVYIFDLIRHAFPSTLFFWSRNLNVRQRKILAVKSGFVRVEVGDMNWSKSQSRTSYHVTL